MSTRFHCPVTRRECTDACTNGYPSVLDMTVEQGAPLCISSLYIEDPGPGVLIDLAVGGQSFTSVPATKFSKIDTGYNLYWPKDAGYPCLPALRRGMAPSSRADGGRALPAGLQKRAASIQVGGKMSEQRSPKTFEIIGREDPEHPGTFHMRAGAGCLALSIAWLLAIFLLAGAILVRAFS